MVILLTKQQCMYENYWVWVCFRSFSVPYDLSMGGSKEVWAESFLERMSSRWEECKHIWSSLDLQVSECYPQAMVLWSFQKTW